MTLPSEAPAHPSPAPPPPPQLKTYLPLFERPFKIQKNGVFLFEISFFVLEILAFSYYANWISDDITAILQLKRGKN